jgi:superfamily II DNA or RNA helicase
MTLLVKPEEQVSTQTASLRIDGDVVSVVLPDRDPRFVNVVRSLSFRWDRSRYAWVRKVGKFTGSVEDRAAEAGRAILAAGFGVDFPDEAVQDKAVSGDYEPEVRRWVLAATGGEYKGWFLLRWGRRRDEVNYYTRAKKITGACYDRNAHAVVVPSDQYREVEDFAQMHDFRFSPGAHALVTEAKQREAKALVVAVEFEDADDGGRRWRRPTLDEPSGKPLPKFIDYRGVDFGVTTALFRHQTQAVEKLAPLTVGGAFMEMGTGKTRVAIELAHRRRRRLSGVVWFCPVSLKATIRHEIHKHTADSAVYVFDDNTTIRSLPRADWYIVGIESMSSSDRTVLAANAIIDEHSMVVVDESSKIKNHDANRTRRITSVGGKARYRMILTGTPVSQGVEDLYAQLRFLSPEILGYNSYYSFAANHLEYHPDYPGMVVRAHNTAWLAAKLQPYVYQVTKDEAGLDLPRKVHEARYFDMTYEQRELYERAKYELLMMLPDDEIDSYAIFRLFGALQQITSGFWNRDGEVIAVDHDRLGTALAAVDSIPPEAKVIIWCKYLRSLHALAGALRAEHGEESVALYYGDLNEQEREAELNRWRSEARFLVATQSTGGYGLTLNEAHHVLFYENGFSYAERLQAEDRCHRIGQEHRVTYVDVTCERSIDTRIQQALDSKENFAAAFRRQIDRVKDDPAKVKELINA